MIRFDPGKHLYTNARGQLVPSVTFLLKCVGAAPAIPRYASIQKAVARGRAVHTAIRLFAEGKLDISTVDPRIMGWFEAFLDWYGTCSLKRARHEVMVIGEGEGYAGTADMIGMNGKAEEVVDFKTGSEEGWHGIQVTLYALARFHEKRKGMNRRCVYLKKNGTWTQTIHTDDGVTVRRAMAVVDVFNIARSRHMERCAAEAGIEEWGAW